MWHSVANETPRSNLSVVNPCQGQSEADFKCWKEYFEELVYQETPEKALAEADKEDAKQGYIRTNCHQIAHVIGRAAAKKFELNVPITFERGNNFCASGYYHGALESVVTGIGKQKIIEQINDICKPLKEKSAYNLPHYDCVHGLGHGVMSLAEYELYDALIDCDRLTDSWERESCYGGVFMENIMTVFNNPEYNNKFLDSNRPMFPCTDVEEKYKYGCYINQTSYALKTNGNNYSAVFELCAQAGEFKETCWQSLGRDASGNTLQSPEGAKQICQLGSSQTAVIECSIGAVKDIIWISGDKSRGDQFCQMQNSAEVIQACQETANNYFSTFQ